MEAYLCHHFSDLYFDLSEKISTTSIPFKISCFYGMLTPFKTAIYLSISYLISHDECYEKRQNDLNYLKSSFQTIMSTCQMMHVDFSDLYVEFFCYL